MRKANYSHIYIFYALLLLCLFITACGRKQTASAAPPGNPPQTTETAININTASAEELSKIPYIGEKFAAKIVEHRERYGPFRRPEHLMLVEGINEKKFRLIRSLVKTD